MRIVAEDCARDYEYLYNNYEGFGAGGTMTLEEIRNTDEYQDFITKVAFYTMPSTTPLMPRWDTLG